MFPEKSIGFTNVTIYQITDTYSPVIYYLFVLFSIYFRMWLVLCVGCAVDVLGCCDVVLDREQFINVSKKDHVEPFGPHLYRKQINVYTGEISM